MRIIWTSDDYKITQLTNLEIIHDQFRKRVEKLKTDFAHTFIFIQKSTVDSFHDTIYRQTSSCW